MVAIRLHNAPRIGELAPEFALADATTGKMVTLSELRREKPTVLFFASYSCITAQEGAPPMARLAKRFAKTANFVLIYIQEAHPIGGFLPPYRGDPYVVAAPAAFAERATAAIRFARERDLQFRILVDSMDDTTAVRWGAWPLRTFVVGQSGRVLYSGKQGPWYFKPSADFDPHLEGVPRDIENLPGYSPGSLEDFLAELEKISAAR